MKGATQDKKGQKILLSKNGSQMVEWRFNLCEKNRREHMVMVKKDKNVIFVFFW